MLQKKVCGISTLTGLKGKEKDLPCPLLLNLMRRLSCGNTSSIVVYHCVLVELYPSSSPLGSCSHGRRAATSGTLPVAHIKAYEGCIQPACNSFVLLFPLPSEICAAYWTRPSAKAKANHYTTISA